MTDIIESGFVGKLTTRSSSLVLKKSFKSICSLIWRSAKDGRQPFCSRILRDPRASAGKLLGRLAMRWRSSRGNAASEWSEDQLDDSFNQTTKRSYCLVFVLYQEGGQETFDDEVPQWYRASIYPEGPGRYLDNSPFELYI